MEFNRREKALIERGYSLSDVERLCSFSKEELDFAVDLAFSRISKDAIPVAHPIAVFVGGQPGCGKSSETSRVKAELGNIIEINIDMYRTYHPRYLEIENLIKEHWDGKITTNDDTPGNDIADFTHRFVSEISDALIERASIGRTLEENSIVERYNMVIEWGMRDPEVPLSTMKDLKEKEYKNIVKYVCVHKDISLEACSIRANVMNDRNHIVRNVPKSFHQLYIDTLPDGINQIYNRGFKDGVIDNMFLILRDGTVVWDNFHSDKLPGDVFKEYLNDKELTITFENSRDMARENSLSELNQLKEQLSSFIEKSEVATKIR